QAEADGAEPYWRDYLKDLQTIPAFTPEERPRAQALVWKHLGELYADEAEPVAEDGFGPSPPDRETERLRTEAIKCLEESLRLDPKHLATYELLLEVYQDWDQPD